MAIVFSFVSLAFALFWLLASVGMPQEACEIHVVGMYNMPQIACEMRGQVQHAAQHAKCTRTSTTC